MFKAKILADSMSPDNVRLTTFELTYPRAVHAELMTHRVFSRNSASSRAIPVKKMIANVLEDPYIPTQWGKNQKGMQAGVELSGIEKERARDEWLRARDSAVQHSKNLVEIGLHKQITNRILEPWMWIMVLVTATEWDNWWHLRDHSHAHPDIAKPARMMREMYLHQTPRRILTPEWHLPLVGQEFGDTDPNFNSQRWCKISVGRCARVSYLTHDGKRDPEKDVELADSLLENGHMSPFEHVARPADPDEYANWTASHDDLSDTGEVLPERMWFGNLRGWVQFRKLIKGEDDMMAPKEATTGPMS